MATRAEALEERQDALDDLIEEGAPVLLRHDPSAIPDGGIGPSAAVPVDVQTYAVVEDISAYELDGLQILQGDKSVKLEHSSLGALAPIVAAIQAGQQPGLTGLSIFVEQVDPAGEAEKAFPLPGGPNVNEYRVLARLPWKPPLGGWHIVHRLQARG